MRRAYTATTHGSEAAIELGGGRRKVVRPASARHRLSAGSERQRSTKPANRRSGFRSCVLCLCSRSFVFAFVRVPVRDANLNRNTNPEARTLNREPQFV